MHFFHYILVCFPVTRARFVSLSFSAFLMPSYVAVA